MLSSINDSQRSDVKVQVIAEADLPASEALSGKEDAEEAAKKEQAKLFEELTPCLSVSNYLTLNKGLRALCIELIVLMIWFTTAYYSNVISIVLLVVILRHVYRRSFDQEKYNYIMYSAVSLILIMYLLAVASLSSYSSPVAMPPNISKFNDSTRLIPYEVYPNIDHYYLDIPFYFEVRNLTHPNSTAVTINCQDWAFFGV